MARRTDLIVVLALFCAAGLMPTALKGQDCNTNGRPDAADIACGGGNVCLDLPGSYDCNTNGTPDACDIANCQGNPACVDCDSNRIPDGCKVNTWEWRSLGNGVGDVVHFLSVHDGGLVAGGNLDTAGGAAAHKIAMWNGSDWQALGDGVGNACDACPNNAPGLAVDCSGRPRRDSFLLERFPCPSTRRRPYPNRLAQVEDPPGRARGRLAKGDTMTGVPVHIAAG